jgi:ABC-2 type transport system ATP-binding protein/lipopolysaccharide transport system ATP-binding protein
MAAINLTNVSVDIPIYDWASASIRKLVLGSTIGGRFAHSHHHLVTNALKNISFEVRQGDRIGLVGANGSGKTTLLRVLSGVYAPTSGSIDVDGQVSPLFDVALGMSMDATGIENIRMCGILWGLTHREIDDHFDEIVEFTELGDYLNMPVRTYSAGMRLRLAFAIATARDPEILLIDEAIGAGDAIFMEKAFARLENLAHRSSILIVASHAEGIIHKLCNKAMWLHRGNLIEYGEVDNVLAAYRELRDDPTAAARIPS